MTIDEMAQIMKRVRELHREGMTTEAHSLYGLIMGAFDEPEAAITERHVREGIGATAGPLETDRLTKQVIATANVEGQHVVDHEVEVAKETLLAWAATAEPRMVRGFCRGLLKKLPGECPLCGEG